MPVDTAALVALSGLASRFMSAPDTGAPASDRTPAGSSGREYPSRRRVAVLAAASVGAGLVCGLLVPVPAEAGAPASTSPAAAAQRAAWVGPALLASPSPFEVRTVAPASAVAPVRVAAGTSPVRVAPVTGAGSLADPTVDPGPPRAGRRPAAPVAAAYLPSRPLPARSGTGRRIVYAERGAHLWVVGADGVVLRDYPVTGRVGRPRPGSYHVYSKSLVAVNPGERLRFEDMVRFAVGVTGARIGFHTIPRYADGVPIQSESQLGRAIGAGGCVRQSRADARWLYAWSRVGDTVVVLP